MFPGERQTTNISKTNKQKTKQKRNYQRMMIKRGDEMCYWGLLQVGWAEVYLRMSGGKESVMQRTEGRVPQSEEAVRAKAERLDET